MFERVINREPMSKNEIKSNCTIIQERQKKLLSRKWNWCTVEYSGITREGNIAGKTHRGRPDLWWKVMYRPYLHCATEMKRITNREVHIAFIDLWKVYYTMCLDKSWGNIWQELDCHQCQ